MVDRHPDVASVIGSIALLVFLQVNKNVFTVFGVFIDGLAPLPVLSEILTVLLSCLFLRTASTEAVKID